MKITSHNYELPIVIGVDAHEQLNNSANQPVIITGLDIKTGNKDEYVVKLNASERMHKEARLRELLAAFIAIELDLHIVEPVIVEIGQDFVNNQLGKDFYLKMSKSLGFNFGSKYIQKFVTLENHITLTQQQEKIAQNIFAFDLLIQNNDRTYEKPNMITDGNQLVILDHELAFGFHMVFSFMRNKEPWKFPEEEMVWVNKHCLLKRLKNKHYELDEFSAKMSNLTDSFWEKAKSLIPVEWMDEDIFLDIRSHISAIQQNKDEFISNLKIILS